MTKYVYDFHEGNKEMKDLLGGKGANLAEMTNMGLRVPPGFTITTEACLDYLEQGGSSPGMLEEVAEHRRHLEGSMGKRLGDPEDPLLVSVRSGAKFSMPGMMDTVLNLGLNDKSIGGLAAQTGDRRFALDAYRRFVQMFGKIVMDVPGEVFEDALDEAKAAKFEGAQDTDLDERDLEALIERFRAIYEEHTGEPFPQDPDEQLRLAIAAVFRSWNGKRARDYRRQNKISDDLGTAVNVQAMVFGNRGEDSGTGVAFTRDPATGEDVPYGDYLPNAQGEDVVAGIRNTLPLAELEKLDPVSYGELIQVMHTLEMHYRDMCDIEFTIERGRLWILQTRIGKRTAFGEWVMAYDMLEDGLIDEDTALLRVDANRLEELFKRTVKAEGATPIATGLNASPGAATGKVVFSADEAEAWAKEGERVILVRRETTPDDYHGMIASQGILTSAGGTNSHAARGSPPSAGPTRSSSTSPPRRSRRTGRRSPRARSSRSTASPATCTWASCRSRTPCSSGRVGAMPSRARRASGRRSSVS
jgi:pyruvate,orthophosphate dikinase